ncbi:uncharacterized protein LOC111703483 [Eurytemora carolleeae]|uniref:uncharacterized protein LOC111703483 n=1 Tax=Eurytemora carolleeae TaxID=1294199 RepID=UPI000C77CE58|nr:uncharacterized protein LOC111703483 [Eurytemora carolleeae]|eukprot:XP_023331199.1 uncharacterized protein LOC111703483 [Eurytemora affinis]
MLNLSRIQIFIYLSCLSASVLAQGQQRAALMNLAKTLSENLQSTISSTSTQIQDLNWRNGNLTLGVEGLEVKVSNSSVLLENLEQRILSLENQTSLLKERRELEENIWKFNTLVCNASLETLRENLEEKISQLAVGKPAPIPPFTLDSSKNSNSKINTEGDKSLDQEGSLSILNKLDNLLADYEYYDIPPPSAPLPDNPGSNTSSVNISVNGSVDTLVSFTNQLLLELNNKYTNLDSKISGLEREGEKTKKKMKENKFEDELLREMTRIEDEVGFKISRIKDDIATGEQSIRTEIKLKDEDIELLKKITTSRLSIYESRIDALESMILNLTISNNQNMEQFLQSNKLEKKDEPEVSTTERSREPEFLSSQTSQDLDRIAAFLDGDSDTSSSTSSSSPSASSFAGSRTGGIDGSSSSRDHYWNKYNSEASNPPLVLKDRYEAADRSRRRSGRWLVSDDYENQDSNNCDCLFMQERLAILESGFENMMIEVEDQMAGIQSSVTRMVHRLQDLENMQSSSLPRSPICVAKQVVAGLDGMDTWCQEQCTLGTCPERLCSCPSTIPPS